MAHYLVRAKPHNLSELKQRIDAGEIQAMHPFGGEMHQALLKARLTDEGIATWEEQCFCSPPLKQERAVLDLYFDNLTTEVIQAGDGWQEIDHLPRLFD